MTPSQIADIRQMRGFGIAWTVISRHQGYSVAECRAAINMPEYAAPTEEMALPWDAPEIRPQRLFDK